MSSVSVPFSPRRKNIKHMKLKKKKDKGTIFCLSYGNCPTALELHLIYYLIYANWLHFIILLMLHQPWEISEKRNPSITLLHSKGRKGTGFLSWPLGTSVYSSL